ncbi:MAG TPA: aminoacyl-tRNA hydrolase [Flavobacterium sp.]|uniref:aminoacyl-tRNA hydrolase n=1 Tax=Flavobacterium sp. TaxID=239 RepID=UPI002D11267C|nr:aminoacyl-tRNA hydrolase [Flavobacterium sp.]HNP32169.1 aminoacyl-tRNA hydrolase [Flavobacterium sp.]
MNWIKDLFKAKIKSENSEEMKKFLIVGLGNIGTEYANTRHNIGFKVLDYIAEKASLNFETAKLGAVTEYTIKGRKLILLKPNTYMNLSGKAVQYWMQKENIARENILVITDDLNLPFGTIRIKGKGSDGGHNGLKNIQLILNTSEYPRFRFGISDEFKKGQQVDYVLGEWNEIEREKLPERFEVGKQIVESFALAGLNETMNSFNGK